jgi:hypothetical protein
MDKKEFRVLMKHCFLANKNNVDKHYTDSASAKSTVEKWLAKFKRGEMKTMQPVDARNRVLPTKISEKSTK